MSLLSDDDTFWVFNHLMYSLKLSDLFAEGFPMLNHFIYLINQQLKQHRPNLHEFLWDHGLGLELFIP